MPAWCDQIPSGKGNFGKKMRAYLTACRQTTRAAIRVETICVLTVTTDHHRMHSMVEALRKLRIPHSPGAPLFSFSRPATSCPRAICSRMSGAQQCRSAANGPCHHQSFMPPGLLRE